MKIIVRGKHKKDCDAVRMVKEKSWNTSWAFAEMEWRDSRGYKHFGLQNHIRRNTFLWLVVPCNDPDCKAHLLIKMNEFLKLLPSI